MIGKLKLLALLAVVITFAGCKANLLNNTAGEIQQSPTPAVDPQTLIEIEADAQADVIIQVPETSSKDDLDSLSAELEATVIAEESFD